MANYTSRVARRQQLASPINTEAIGFVLQSKEAAWDRNQAKLDSILNQVGSLDLLRSEDKEYVLGNVERMLGSINNVGSLDLSSDQVGRGLENAVLDSIDDYTINQVAIARQKKAFDSTILQAQKDGTYNQMNHQVALKRAGYDSYMKGDTDTLGSLQYNPYIDVSKTLDEEIQKNLKLFGIERTTMEGGQDGFVHKNTRNVVSRDRIQRIIQGSMTAEMQNQLGIEAEYSYGDAAPEVQQDITTRYSQKISSDIRSIDSAISELENEKSQNTGTPKEAELLDNINLLKEQKQSLQQRQEQGFDYKTAYTNYYNENFLESKYSKYETNELIDTEIDKSFLELQKAQAAAQKKATSQPNTAFTDSVIDLGVQTEDSLPDQVSQLETTFSQSYDNFKSQVVSEIQSGNLDFINFSQYSSLSPEDQDKQVQKIYDIINQGQDLKNSYPKSLVEAAQSYKSARENFDATINPMQEAVAKMTQGMYEGLQEAHKRGGFNPNNFRQTEVAQAIKNGVDFNNIKSNKKQFTKIQIGLIDQILREDLQGNDGVFGIEGQNEKMLRLTRDRLLATLPKSEQGEYVSTKVVGQSSFSNFFGGIGDLAANTLQGIANFFKGDIPQEQVEEHYRRGSEAVDRLRETYKERSYLNTAKDIIGDIGTGQPFQSGSTEDKFLRDIDSNIFERDFYVKNAQGQFEGKGLDEFLKETVGGAMTTVTTEAKNRVNNLESRLGVVLNTNLVGADSAPIRNAGKSLINKAVAKQKIDVSDINEDLVYFSYDKNTATATVNLVEKDGDRVPVLFKLSELDPQIQNSLVTEIENTAYNAMSNPAAQSHKYHSTVFESENEKLQTINKLMQSGDIDYDLYQVYRDNLDGLGYDKDDILLEAKTAKRESAEGQAYLTNEYPKAIENLMSGRYRFKVEYNPVYGKGYFAETFLEDSMNPQNRIPLMSPQPMGEHVKPTVAKLDAFAKQAYAMGALFEGYQKNDKGALKIFQQLNK